MPTTRAYTLPSDPASGNEDWYLVSDGLVIVLDGATIRTDTGCIHGLRWYVHQLGLGIATAAADHDRELPSALESAISRVNGLHADTCDLTHPGTPSAAAGIVRYHGDRAEWAVLGDITVMVDTTSSGLTVTCDDRVSHTAPAERRECDRHLIGTPEKMRAILAMKQIELASRNRDGGYWIASTMPSAAEHAHTGSAPLAEIRRIAVCSDGAMRALDMTSINTAAAVMHVLTSAGPQTLIDQVRAAENRDPLGKRHPRNKATDDATALIVDFTQEPPPATTSNGESRATLAAMMNRPVFGASPTRDGRTL